MLTAALMTWLALHAGPPAPDTVVDPVLAYAPVLADLRAKARAGSRPCIVLNAMVFNADPGTSRERVHSPEVLERLRARGQVQAICRGPRGSPGCPPRGKRSISVRLGPIIALPDSARVKAVPEPSTPGVPFEEILAAIPDSMAIPVDVAVDVVVRTPCPEAPGSERCRVPDIVSYRYFLQARPDGTYHVVTRWFNGAV